MITVHPIRFCRGDGSGYLELAVSGVPFGEEGLYQAFASIPANDGIIPCSLYWPDAVEGMWSEAPERRAVLVFPLLDKTHLTLHIATSQQPEHALYSYTMSALSSKVRSRLAYHMHANDAYRIRDIDKRLRSANGRAEVTGIYADGKGGRIVRLGISLPYRPNVRYQVVAIDDAGNRLDCNPLVLEDAAIPSSKDRQVTVRRLTFSVPIGAYRGTVCLYAQASDNKYDGAFVCLLPPMSDRIFNDCGTELCHASLDSGYDAWFRQQRATSLDVCDQRTVINQWEDTPLISIVCVVFRTPAQYLQELLHSILSQSYEHFELILVNVSGTYPEVDSILDGIADPRITVIAAPNKSIPENTNLGIAHSHGDYIAFVDHDDVIEPDTLYRYVSEIRNHPDADMLYCDEDKINENGRYEWPVFKPAFNRDLLYSYNYITHMLMISRTVLDQVELSPSDVSGAQDYDLTLKCSEHARAIHNVPHMLYHWREHEGSTSKNAGSKPYAVEAGRIALQQHFNRMAIPAKVEILEYMFRYRPQYAFEKTPKVSIIIPTKDHIDLLSVCLQSVFEKTEYGNYEIIIAENNSTEPETFAYYDNLEQSHDNLHVVRWPGVGFNYSAICNYGAQHASGDILLFLNNDTEVIAPHWLNSMVGFFVRPEVGIVGAKLLYKDGLVQHGGVWVSPGGCDYINQRCAADELGYMETLQHPFDCAAITGACQMIRRSVFDLIHGFDESLDVVLNDVDLCLKNNEAGYLTVFNPDALLYHNEYSSRGHDEQNPDKAARAIDEQMRFYARWSKKLLLDRGRYLNRNLDQYNGHFKIAHV
ncbi:glycosyltransferase [Bifidobacterium sp. SO4]|uniref:glycosyltransferase family 2 protein n=1 Tax=Bifidobacterium sp. SO4 TaxID=2809030 RepID=UPI001BDC7059|nr:glycosyltransferase [Bifidobacterium sp. SO4]MBT1170596.1 glycosyltransferase [Bifidobacterium sp. SO4]